MLHFFQTPKTKFSKPLRNAVNHFWCHFFPKPLAVEALLSVVFWSCSVASTWRSEFFAVGAGQHLARRNEPWKNRPYISQKQIGQTISQKHRPARTSLVGPGHFGLVLCWPFGKSEFSKISFRKADFLKFIYLFVFLFVCTSGVSWGRSRIEIPGLWYSTKSASVDAARRARPT